MRVALVYRNFNMSGSLERDAVLAARALIAHGVDVHIYCNPDARDAEIPGAVFHDVRPLARSRSRFGYPTETATFAASATRALRRDRADYDVIDVRGTAAWEHDIVTVHGVTRAQQCRWRDTSGSNYRAPGDAHAARSGSAPADRSCALVEHLQFRRGRYSVAVAVTEAVADDLAHFHHVPRDRIAVVSLPIDLDAYLERGDGGAVRATLGIDDSTPLLLFVGNEFDRKGLADAIGAVRASPGAELVVVGRDSPDRYLKLAAQLGVADRIHFVGTTSSPEVYFRAADLFVLPTKEGPVGAHARRGNGSRRAVGDDGCGRRLGRRFGRDAGIVVPAGDSAAFVAAVARLVADAGKRRDARRRTVARPASASGPRLTQQRLIAVYERVVRERELQRA